MKTLKVLSICALSGLLFASCSQKSTSIEGVSAGLTDSVSYAVGLSFGGMLKSSNLDNLNYDEVVAGMKAIVNNEEFTKATPDKAPMLIQEYISKVVNLKSTDKKKEQDAFFAENAKKEGVQTTESGLQYKIIEAGSNVKPTVHDRVEVNYKGSLTNGKEFDKGESAKFGLSTVITGWSEGIQLVGEGGKIMLWIPYELGYNERAMGNDIPSFSTLVFEIDLIKVNKAEDNK